MCRRAWNYLLSSFPSNVDFEKIMEKFPEESTEEAMRSKTAFRCAKAAFLLSSLKSSQNRHLRAAVDEQTKVLALQFTISIYLRLWSRTGLFDSIRLLINLRSDFWKIKTCNYLSGEREAEESCGRFEDPVGYGASEK